MKLFTSDQIKWLDEFTINHEPVSSIDLMERASLGFVNEFIKAIDVSSSVFVFVGPGNNGGDGLAIARLLLVKNYSVRVFVVSASKYSSDFLMNLSRLKDLKANCIYSISDHELLLPSFETGSVIIDALFGTGLKRPLTGMYEQLVNRINESGCTIVSVDIPSGLPSDLLQSSGSVVKATYTYSFQHPKISFFLPESEVFLGQVCVLNIGLMAQGEAICDSTFHMIDLAFVKSFFHNRAKFSHKGTYGHLALLSGSVGMAGASVLASKAALRSGCGLVTVYSTEKNREILQTAVPESIFRSYNQCDQHDLNKFSAFVVGPGLEKSVQTELLIRQILTCISSPLVLDADALNMLSTFNNWPSLLPPFAILTPHPGEFDRLFGSSISTSDRIRKATLFTSSTKCILVLKGAHTAVILPDGQIYFNSSGNSGMATAGSGDVLSGIIGSLLAQLYSPVEAACFGVFLHGLAADEMLSIQSPESLIAGDIVDGLAKAFFKIIK